MQGSDIIKLILNDLGVKAPTFAKSIGLQYQRILDIQNNKTKKISTTVADCIVEKYPQYSRTWLLTGEGEMYVKGREKDAIAGTSSTTTVESLMRMNEVLVESNKGLVESNRSLAESNRLLAESNKTMADMQKSLLEETRSILRRLEKGDAATVVSIADAG